MDEPRAPPRHGRRPPRHRHPRLHPLLRLRLLQPRSPRRLLPRTTRFPRAPARSRIQPELIAALEGSNQDIVLADGTYDNATAFNNANNNRLYAAHLGGATFKAGLILGGNFGAGGGLVQGVAFDVSSPDKVLGGGIIHVWGPGGARSQVLDCTFRGDKVISAGIKAYQPSGFVARRLQFFNFTDFGMLVTDNATVAYGSATPRADAISDISVDGVARPARGSSNGPPSRES